MNEDARRQLVRLTSIMDDAARNLPMVVWEVKTPFMRAFEMCVEALKKTNDYDAAVRCRAEVNVLKAYIEHCRRVMVEALNNEMDGKGRAPGPIASGYSQDDYMTVMRIPPTSGDTGPEDPTPVCR